MTVTTVTSSVKMNPLGAIIGAAAGFYLPKKFMKVENKYALAGFTLVGLIAGAMVQSKMKSKATIKPAISTAK